MSFSPVREVNPPHQSSYRSGPSTQMQTQCRSCVVRSMAVGDYQQAEVVAAIRHSALCPPNPHAHWEPRPYHPELSPQAERNARAYVAPRLKSLQNISSTYHA